MNELMYSKGVTGKRQWLLTKSKQKDFGFVFNMYNQIKQDWSSKVRQCVAKSGFKPVESCHFNYLVIERTKKRDPSNVFASAIKFVEDGLQSAGVIPNDSWDTVLGIRSYVHLDREVSEGILLVMANEPLSYNAMISYYNQYREQLVNAKSLQKVNSNKSKDLHHQTRKGKVFP